MNKTHLNSEQRIAAEHVNGPMLVVAGPGSGKTHLLIERLHNLIERGIEQNNILVITFSKKAATEMENRFKQNYGNNSGINFGTFHAVFFGILKYHNIYDTDGILDNKTKYRLIENAGISLGIKNAGTKNWQLDMLEKISCYKNIGKVMFEKNNVLMDQNDFDSFYKVYDKYRALCSAQKKLDFDDMVYECKKFLEKNKDALQYWQNRFKYILIDEFQDINPVQYDVIKLLCHPENNIFAVGDDDQSIYGFRGSMPGIMNVFLSDFDNCKKVVLRMNYRSCFQIVDAANNLITHNKDRITRQRQSTLSGRKPGAVIRRVFATAEDEATYVLNEISKYDSSDVAIIYRSDHCSSLIEDKIKQAGITYDKKIRPVGFYEIEAVAVIISYLKCAVKIGDKSDYLRILNKPERLISRDALDKDKYSDLRGIYSYYKKCGIDNDDVRFTNIDKLIADLEMISNMPPTAAIIYILKGIGVYSYLESSYKKDARYPYSLDELINELKSKCAAYTSIELFLHRINVESINIKEKSRESDQADKSKNKAVTFITAHASKGLEYPVVFVVGLQEGLFPHRKNLEGPGLEEERRLFYVAMTRAKERLYLCAIGSEYGKIPSRFVNETNKIFDNQSFIASNSSSSRNSSKASSTASYSSSSSIYSSSGSMLGSFSSSE